MCGRFTSTTPASEVAAYFDAETDSPDLDPNFNVTPTSDVNVILEDEAGHRRLEQLFWGLVPSWAESPAIGSRLINARSETAAVKPSFRAAFRRKRCIIPVDGFYEWVQIPEHKRRQPVYISARDNKPLAFAGLWESWRPKSAENTDELLRSCSILTGPPNEMIAPLHDRMPMILPRESWDVWLDPTNHNVDLIQGLLVPAPNELLQWWPVSLNVNNVRNHGSNLVERRELPPEGESEGQGRLL